MFLIPLIINQSRNIPCLSKKKNILYCGHILINESWSTKYIEAPIYIVNMNSLTFIFLVLNSTLITYRHEHTKDSEMVKIDSISGC